MAVMLLQLLLSYCCEYCCHAIVATYCCHVVAAIVVMLLLCTRILVHAQSHVYTEQYEGVCSCRMYTSCVIVLWG